MMTGATFLYQFRDVLPQTWAEVSDKPSSLKDQTRYMVRRLHLVAQRHGFYCCCTYAPHAAPTDPNAVGIRGEKREYLFDLTWFRGGSHGRQPDVLIEHEFLGLAKDFMDSFGKVLVGYAPLRIMIGYAPSAELCESYIPMIDKAQNTAQWRFPEATEDIVLIGYQYMTPRHFRVLHRAAGATAFVDLGWLPDLQFAPSSP